MTKAIKTVVYVHGKGGSAKEAEHYKPIFPDSRVIGFNYRSNTPWDAEREFTEFFGKMREKGGNIILIANSIGAYFSLSALSNEFIDKAYFISPVVDMEELICNMLRQMRISESELEEKSEIAADFGETLSWKYLCYVREHPIHWDIPTYILYGGRDYLTSAEAVKSFAERHNAKLTVMPEGEHWFHTEGQMRFLDSWIKKAQG